MILLYKLWSNEHQAWWRPRAMGYTEDPEEAGLYTEADAVHHALQGALHGDKRKADVIVVHVPRTTP